MPATNSQEKVYKSKTSKIHRYNWSTKDAPGTLCMIKKGDIEVDHSYQRFSNDPKVLALARDWSWIACGVIVVAKRNGTNYAIDGMHRVLAANKRSDIDFLPCLVFQTHDVQQEAHGFLCANAHRKPVTALEKFKALAVVGDRTAMTVQEMLISAGRTIGSHDGHGVIKCVGILQRLVATDDLTMRKIWPLMCTLTKGVKFRKQLVEGIFFIEKKMPEGESLTDKKWQDKLTKVGSDNLLSAIADSVKYRGSGQSRVYAEGILNAINKSCHEKNRLTLTTKM